MGLLDTMKQDDEQQSTTETLAELTSTLYAVEQHRTKLTSSIADLTGFVKVMEEQRDLRLTSLSTSQQPEQPEQPLMLPLDDETSNRLTEIDKTLAAVAQQLSASEAVKLPDGSSVTRSDVQVHAMTTRIKRHLATVSKSADELAEAVRKRGRIVIDVDNVNAHFAGHLDARLQRALDPSVARVEAVLAWFEEKVATIGAARTAAASGEVEGIISKVKSVVSEVRGLEHSVDDLSARVTRTAVGRMALALLPLAAVLLVVGA